MENGLCPRQGGERRVGFAFDNVYMVGLLGRTGLAHGVVYFAMRYGLCTLVFPSND